MLETARSRPRPWRASDLHLYLELTTDPEVTRHRGGGETADRELTWRNIAVADRFGEPLKTQVSKFGHQCLVYDIDRPKK